MNWMSWESLVVVLYSSFTLPEALNDLQLVCLFINLFGSLFLFSLFLTFAAIVTACPYVCLSLGTL